MDYEALYGTMPDFKVYVDRYCKSYGVSIQEALRHRLVRNVADYYASNMPAKILVHTDILMGCGSGHGEDKSC